MVSTLQGEDPRQAALAYLKSKGITSPSLSDLRSILAEIQGGASTAAAPAAPQEGGFSNLIDQAQVGFMGTAKGALQGVAALGEALPQWDGGDPNEGLVRRGISWLDRRINAPENQPPPGMEDSLGTNTGRAIGSALAFAPAAIGATLAAPQTGGASLAALYSAVTAGGLGALAEAGPAYYDTLTKTGDREDAWRAYFGHGAFGATEGLAGAVPGIGRIASILGKFEVETGKRLIPGLIAAVAKGGAEEAAQEMFQNVGEAEFDKFFLKHPTEARDFLDIVKDQTWQAGVPAFLTGGLFGGMEVAAARATTAQEGAGKQQAQPGVEGQVAQQGEQQANPALSNDPTVRRFRQHSQDAEATYSEPRPELAPVVEAARRMGSRVREVQTTADVRAYYDPESGDILVNSSLSPDEAANAVLDHEILHRAAQRTPTEWQGLRDEINAADPDGLKAQEDAAAEGYQRVTGEPIGEALKTEEGVSYYTERVLRPWMRGLREDRAKVERIARDNRPLFRKIVESVLDVLNSFGAKFKTYKSEVQSILRETGQIGRKMPPAKAAQLALRVDKVLRALENDSRPSALLKQAELGPRGEPLYQTGPTINMGMRSPSAQAAASKVQQAMTGTTENLSTPKPAAPLALPAPDISGRPQPLNATEEAQLQRDLESIGYPTLAESRRRMRQGVPVTPNESIQLGPFPPIGLPESTSPLSGGVQSGPVREDPGQFENVRRKYDTPEAVGVGEPPQGVASPARTDLERTIDTLRKLREAQTSPAGKARITRMINALEDTKTKARFSTAANHGSHADFEAFESSRIGTGEGSGSYGFGLYFADSRSVAEHYAKRKPGGIVYSVELAPKDSEYLLWDKTLDDQSDFVKGALSSIGIDSESTYPTVTGKGIYESLSRKRGAAYYASAVLGKIGIRGVKYLDALSRGDGSGSYNYVIFNDADVKITDKRRFSTNPAIPEETTLERKKRLFVDSWNTLNRITDETLRNGGKLSNLSQAAKDKLDFVTKERLRRDLTSQADSRRASQFYDRFVDVFRAHPDVSMDEVSDILQARHNEERIDTIAAYYPDSKILPDSHEFTGMSPREADAILAKYRAMPAPQRAAVDTIMRIHDAMVRTNLERLRKAGLLTQEQYDQYRTGWKHYTPLRTDVEAQSEGLGSGVSLRGSEFKMAKGRRSRADNSLVFAITQDRIGTARIEKAKVEKALADFVTQVNDPTFAQVLPAGAFMHKVPVERNGRTVLEDRVDPGALSEKNVLPIKLDGKQYGIKFNEKHTPLVTALKYADMVHGPEWLRQIAAFTRGFKRLATQHNPAFVPVNFARDLQTTFIRQFGEKGAKWAFRVLKDTPLMWKEIRSNGPMFQRYKAAGGIMSTQGVYSFEENKAALEKEIHASDGRLMMRRAMKWVDGINDMIENGGRLAVFKNMVEAGASDQAAALGAKEANLNFGIRGEVAPALDSLYAFWGANVAGSRAIALSLKHKRTWGLLGSAMVGAAVLDQMNRTAAGDDDDGENRYDKIPQYEKDQNLLLMIPGTGDYAKIPLPPGFSWFYNIGQRLSAATSGPDEASDAAAGIFGSLVDNVSPFGSKVMDSGDTFTMSAPGVMQAVSPTFTDPLVQSMMNADWRGKPIRPENLPFGPQKPDHELYYKGQTAPLMVSATQALNDMVDFDNNGRADVSLLDVSPSTIQHLVRSYMIGPFKILNQAADAAQNVASDKDVEARNMPIVNRFVGDENPYHTVSKFRENQRAVEEADGRLKELVDAGETERARAWLDANKALIGKATMARRVSRAVSALPDTPQGEGQKHDLMARFNRAMKGTP